MCLVFIGNKGGYSTNAFSDDGDKTKQRRGVLMTMRMLSTHTERAMNDAHCASRYSKHSLYERDIYAPGMSH